MIRATPKGTGWIKADSNYVISALAKKQAEDSGFMEVLFLDAVEHKYVQEGSSCNAFFYLKSGELVTPELGDTVLPGITRKSVIVPRARDGRQGLRARDSDRRGALRRQGVLLLRHRGRRLLRRVGHA